MRRTEVTKKLWEYIKAKKSDAKKWMTNDSSGSYVMLTSVEGVDVSARIAQHVSEKHEEMRGILEANEVHRKVLDMICEALF